jgi:hypothetical protein
MFEYNGIKFDDANRKRNDGLNDWSQVCQHCVDKYHIDHSKLDDAGSGICGVSGCSNEADYYIDFQDGELKEIEDTEIEENNTETIIDQVKSIMQRIELEVNEMSRNNIKSVDDVSSLYQLLDDYYIELQNLKDQWDSENEKEGF